MNSHSAHRLRATRALCGAVLGLLALPLPSAALAQATAPLDWEVIVATRKVNTAGGSLNRYSCTDAAGHGHGLYLNYNNARLTLERRDAWKATRLRTARGSLPGGMGLGEWYTLRLARAGNQLTASAYVGLVDPATATPALAVTATDASHGVCTQFNINGGRDFDTDDVRVFVGGQLALADDFDAGQADGWTTLKRGRIALQPDGTGYVLRKSGYNDPHGGSHLLDTLAYEPGDGFGADLLGRLDIRDAGLKAVSADALGELFGLTEAQARGALAAGQIALSNQGTAVPILPDATFGSLRFDGQAIDSLYSLDNPYFLSAGPGQAMTTLDATPGTAAPTALVTAVTEVEEDNFAALLVADDPDSDYWYWRAFVGGDATYGAATIELPVPGAQALEQVTLRFKGAGATAHQIDVQVAGGEVLGTVEWSGFDDGSLALDLSNVPVNADSLTLELIASGAGEDFSYFDGATLTYARAPVAEDGQLAFIARGETTAISGFTSRRVEVLDHTDPAAPKQLTGVEITADASGYSARFATVPGHAYLAVEAGAVATLVPDAEATAEFQPGAAYDYVLIIPPPEAVAESPGEPTLAEAAEALADYRAGQGLGAAVVGVEEITQHFGDGLATPQAVSAFIDWAAVNWGTRYVVLSGTGSYDYRNLLGHNDNLVPTQLAPTPDILAACDGCLAGDSGVLIGRVPAVDGAGLDAFRTKLAAYEARAVGRTDAFKLLLMADDAAAEGDFPADSDALEALLQQADGSLPADLSVEKLYVDPANRSAAAGAAVTALNAGQDWANYIGHASVARLAGESLLSTADITALTSAQVPVISALTCVVNRFELAGLTALGEALVMAPGTGAVALFGPSGTSQNSVAVAFGRELFSILFNPADPSNGVPTLGEALDEALARNAASAPPHMLRIYRNLLGDPATLLHMVP
jgi:hypothetical protein